MKTIRLLLLLSAMSGAITTNAQQNELPPNGDVGIGTTSPTSKLDVRGDARITEDLKVSGSSFLSGTLYLHYLLNTFAESDELLVIDPVNGSVKSGGALQTAMYADAQKPCKDNNNGYTIPASATWANGPGKLYTSTHCVPDVKVGIGTTTPESKLHIRLHDEHPGINTHALIVEKEDGSKLLQLDENGLLQAREIKVDLAAWPDYVFETDYVLMPLEEVRSYIDRYHHLPNVATACELEESGMNLRETNVLLMEKVEELTLYLIGLQEQLNAQQQQLDLLQQAAKP